VLRLQEDGKPAPDNPWAAGGALAEIWTYGHRNIQGLAYDPVHQRVLASEHGSRGGDELNVLKAGGNYGWPAVTYSREYWGPAISERRTTLGMEDPVVVWTPATAPSGLAVYTGDRPMKWRGSVFSGGLLSRDVRRIQLDNRGHVLEQESIPIGGRVRDVRQGPDGFLYVLTDERRGRLLRIELELP
jgi:aldose sugar dehydrogenase